MKNNWKSTVFFFLVVLISMLLLVSCKGNGTPAISQEQDLPKTADTESKGNAPASGLLDSLEITLPDGMERQRISNTQESILSNTATVGGIFLLGCDNSIFDDVLGYSDALTPLVLKAMKDIGLPEMEWYMGESSSYGLHEYNMGNGQSEYIAYIIRGSSDCYVLWFDRKQVSYDAETAIMQSVHSDDITEELNKISSEAYMEAIAESMKQGDYRFEVVLPEEIIQKETAAEGALFYKSSQLIGGYKTVHFEKGILPAVQDNEELILTLLKQYMSDQIDLTEFAGEITDKALITAVFTNGGAEYTHYILSYGQVGTQYVIWLDTAVLDQQTIDSILWGAQLVAN